MNIRPLLLTLLLLGLTALAQTPGATPPAATPTAPIWRCQLPGGTYEVALRSITAVSSHEYVVDGGVRVTEVNVSTNGSLLARFYYLDPSPASSPTPAGAFSMDKIQSQLGDAAAKTGNEPWKKVVKSYPTSTHAHTVEYRLESKESLKSLFTSVETAFVQQRPGAFQGK